MSTKYLTDDEVFGSGGQPNYLDPAEVFGEEQPQPTKKERTFGEKAADMARTVGAAGVSALGAIPTAAGRAIEEGGQKLFGLTMDEARRMAEADGTPDRALEYYEKANRLNPVAAAGRVIEAGGRKVMDVAQGLRDARSEEAKQAIQDSTPTGDITSPSTWTAPKDPSVEGVLGVGAEGVGSMAPSVATAIATRGRSAETQMRAGGGSVAAQVGGAAMDEAGEYLGSFDDQALAQASPVFRNLVDKGYKPEQARALVLRDAENRAAAFAAPAGLAGGKATAALLGKWGERVAAGAITPVRAAVLAALGATEEGLQEVAEGVATRAGINDAAGTDRSVTEGTLEEFTMGAMGGGPVAGGHAVMDAAARRLASPPPASPAQQDPDADEGNPDAVSRETRPPPRPPQDHEAVGTADTDEAARALRTPVNTGPLERADEIDQELARIRTREAELTPDNGYGPAFDQERAELAQQAQALAAEREQVAQAWPKLEAGAPASFSTEAGVRLEGQYALVEADDLVTSHNESLRPDPRFPSELQPRDRTRQASELQVSGIVQRLDPARLGVSADAATGAPIIGKDGLVESGNARTIALKRVYQANGQKAEDYKAFLRENAGQFGLAPEAIDGMRRPVLVRVRATPVNRAEFARQANQATIQRMAPSEQALADAKRLTSLEGLEPDDNGDFDTSYDFIRQFMATLPVTEQSGMLESDGRLSTEGYRRMQNAVLARAYGDSPTLRRMTEAREDNLRNISKALLRVAPRVAEARERIDAGTLTDADLTGDLLAAVEGLGALRERGWSVDDELGQADLTGPKYSPESAALLRFLADNLRAPRRIAEFVQRYYEALEQAGDPSQATMFDDGAPAPTRAELLQRAQGEPDGNDPAAPGQGGDREGAGAAREGGEQRTAAPGDQGGDQGAGPARTDAGGGQQGPQEGEAEWVMYPPESGTLGIPRAQMPQVKKRDRAALVQFLEARGIPYEIQDDTDPNTLKPTQAEYQPSKAHSFAQSGDKERSVLVSREGHVLDGHHQWMGAQEAGDAIRVIRFDAPIEELLEATFEFPSVQRSEGAPGVAPVAMIDGRPYDPERDNFQPPPLAEVLPADVLQRADGYVDRFYKAAKPYQMTPDERAVGERLLAPRMEQAKATKVEFDQKVIDLAERVGALGQILGDIKSAARAVEKMHQDAQMERRPMRADDVKDLLRATIVVEAYADAEAVLDALGETFDVQRVKDRRGDGARAAQGGYADVLVNVIMPSGVTAEIQINTPAMLAAKGEQGHKLYEVARNLPQGDAQSTAVMAAMSDLYAAAFAATRARDLAANSRDFAATETNAASESGAPVAGPLASMPGSATSDAPSSEALNQAPSGNRTNSSPEKPATNEQPDGKDSGNFIDEPRDDILSDPSGNGYTAEVEQPQGTRLSRGAGAGGVDAGGGMDFDQLKALAERIKAGMPNMPNVRVLPDPSKAPKALREYIVRQDAWDDVEGAMHDGELYLFASGLSDPLRAEHVLAEHEAAHYGLRGILGDKLRVAMNVIYAENGTVRRAANKLRATSRLTVAEAVEEVIVDMPTRELARLQGWRRLVGLVRDTLAARGFERMADRLTGWLHGTLSDQQRADLMVAELVRGAREFVAGKRPGERTIAAATRLSATLAEDIERQEKWLNTEARARGYKDIEDLVEQNYPLFERLAELWRERNPAETLLSRRKGLAERVEDILGKPAATMKPLDAMARAATRYTGLERLTSAVYDRAAYLLDRYTPEQVKAGVVADYGVPQAVIDQRVMLQGRQRVQLRKAGKLVDKLATLTREESRVAYEWMNMDGSDPKAYLSKMDGLPEESVEVLLEVQKLVDDLSKEAVRLGQLTPEAFERNRFAYLRRSYAKHVVDMTAGEKAKRARVISILGEQYRGRGLTEAADMDKLKAVAPEWWGRKLKAGKADTALKGEKFIRLERRETKGAGVGLLPGIERDTSAGKLREVTYWPADEKLPPQLKDWLQAGTFEVRDVKGPKAILWRDFTKDERERMGEVDEARFAIAKTLHAMIHDVEVGRYLEWMSTNQAKKEGEEIPGAVVEASERMRDTFKPGEWVRVPDTKIAGTSVLKYGKLAGRYLPGPVWNDIRQVVGGQFKPFGETYSKILSLWKTSKTALSPAVHMNNVMSNFIMADWHGVTAGHVAKSLRILMGASQRKGQGLLGKAGNLAARGGIADHEAAREILARYEDSGGDIGSWVTNEIARDQLEPLLQSLEKELQQTAGASHQAQTGVFAALQHMLMLRFPSAWEAFKPTVPGKVLATEANNLIELYQHEDDVFRLAAWLRAKEEGASDIEAGRAARKSFLDYSINAPWIQAMRQSAWPFISFTYRAVPMLAEIAGKKPHKLLKLMMVLGGLNALGSMLAGGDDDDDERARKLLPEEKAGKIWGIVPKLIRMPWNDEHGSPVYLDIRRFIPVGDVFDVGAGQAAIPVLPGLMPGGPLVLAGEVMLNKSAFTGKSISQDTDTAAQQATKVADHLYKAFAPNIVVLPNTYAWEGVEGSLTGRTDAFGREMSTTQALLSSVGVKLGSYPADVLRRNLVAKTKAQEAEIDKNITQLKRQLQTNRLSREEFDKAVQVEREKKAELLREMAEKLR